MLDRTFGALSDPTRRAILTRLRKEPGLSVTELARPHGFSLQAISKHLDVLEGAGLLTRKKIGRNVECRLRTAPMESAAQWLQRYESFWSGRFDRLAAVVEADHRSNALRKSRKKK